jgi:dipeptide transport system substrate-binding protein
VVAALAASLSVHAAGTLTVCTEASPDGFDVAQYTSAVTNDAAGNTIYDQLLMRKRGSTEVVPGLAERWDLSADGLQVTLHLRKGVQFQTTPWFTPTREFNADDVMFSINRLMDRNSPWRKATTNGFTAWDSYGMADLVKAVDKLDAMTVRFTLRRPSAPFPGDLAQWNTSSVYSAEYGAKLLASGQLGLLNTQPVGTGPFALRGYQKDAVIRYTPHPGYWGGKPTLDNLIFAITPDNSVRIQRLKAGECLVGSNMRAETIDSLAGTPIDAPGSLALLTGYIVVNHAKPFLSDKRFREALRLAFDQKSFIASVYSGKAEPATSFLPPTQWGFDATMKRSFDPERAKALVKAAGYDGTELAIATRIGGSIDGKRAAELMQGDWARIGVKTRVQMVEWGEMLKRTGRGDFDISFLNWAANGDPDDFFTPNLTCAAVEGGSNRSRWCNKAFDELVDTARASSDRTQRIALYAKAQRMVDDDVALIPTVYPQYFIAVNRKVKGFIRSPTTDLDFRGVSVGEK